MEKKRCRWCNLKNEWYVRYHDEEWGVPVFDDARLFELLLLEPFQAGLSWEIILNKRESFRKAFSSFDVEKICCYDEKKVEELLQDASIVRNRRKIEAAINNAAIFKKIQQEWGSFSAYIWHFSKNKIVYEWDKTRSALSDEIAGDMKRRGMKFIGSTTVYAFLQAMGMIYAHEPQCYLFREKA